MDNISTESFEPAMDGPPSPERIRAIGKQLKRSSFRDKHLSHNTVSSKSSSLLSATSETPSWELGPDIISRRSSQRSSNSSNPAREPTDGTASFGKGIFNRRGKGRREGTDTGASHGALSSMPSISDLKSGARDLNFVSTMFARRKGSRPEIDAAEQKKLQISGPYNFQHLTHTQKGSVPDLNRTSRMDLVSEFASMRAGQKPSIGELKGIEATEIHVSDLSSESLPLQGEREDSDTAAGRPESRGQQQAVREKELPATPGEAWFKKHTQSMSQDIAKLPPPRPKRSPSEPLFPSPIPPPPRISSRVSVRFENGQETLTAIGSDRPWSSAVSRMPQPALPAQEQSIVSQAPAGQDDAAWPLTPPSMSSVPEVPEEDEAQLTSVKSRASVMSTRSSLRGSVSVPLLRQLSQNQAKQRRPSNTSDTLGHFSAVTIRQGADSSTSELQDDDDFMYDDWEDDIDYCYDHEAEADCDYAWERPSLEMWREDDDGAVDARATFFTETFGATGSRRTHMAETRSVSPASPMSPRSKPHAHAASNSTLTLPITTNFSLPDRGHNRTLSRASSTLGSQEFTLSPSLLIPNDYQQQMLSYEREVNQMQEDEDDDVPLGQLYNKSALMLKVRSSASTTASALSEHSLASSRHKSTLSTSTAFTRWTGISTAGSMDWQQHAEASCLEAPPPKLSDECNMTPTAGVGGMTLPKSSEPYWENGLERRQRTASEANILTTFFGDDSADKVSAEGQIRTRRRAKTTSRSHTGPPQFGLFPQVPPSA
ncbi:uncharacterized protein B0I36DRAFT_71371 [Microdochium trichocladiopsis]|uniref:CRIB domain-containing protein n=1 Tax=Microdochium trichocladiopsis TaxID=1682393 RepID=A0A9P8YH11_9PEZI|nr:uncharacterized protein B0I36DRAFT_71371 [Microdochium trichocladiopsis]KAH7037809.1 hypothetical protein B0I36DRAFT_71371 [Microdochium trichocladiopsis]